MSHDQRPRIAVLGSINMDLVATCNRLPEPGQTLSAQAFSEIPGGKGANQAVAAARAGGAVRMMGCLGDDGFAERLHQSLLDEQVECNNVLHLTDQSSGVAMILVDETGQNQIVVVPGANGKESPDMVTSWESVIRECDVLLLQLEVPLETVRRAIELAGACGTKVILDPAPAPASTDGLTTVDLCCPNETEAAAMTGQSVETDAEVEAAARRLQQMGAAAVAITLGARGVGLLHEDVFQIIAPPAVQVVDTTAAGDAFAGATAVRWAETGSLPDAVRWGVIAGALAATKAGAQPGMPLRSEIESFAQSCHAS
jgi:ribokinase